MPPSTSGPTARPARARPKALKEDIKAASKLLSDRARDLKDIPIPKMQETLQQMLAMTQKCQRAKRSLLNDLTICTFLNHINTLEQVILWPIVNEYRRAIIGFTEYLKNELYGILGSISDVISYNLPQWKFWQLKANVYEPLGRVNSTMSEIFQHFKAKGRIVLIRVKSPTSDERWSELDLQQPQDHPATDSNEEDNAQENDSSPIIGINDLEPHINEVFRVCPRFRILLLGRSGVGKSRLINRIFNITEAEVSHHRAGTADIEKEFTSAQNPRFVLHDSYGFEYGSEVRLKGVKRFIQSRTKEDQKPSERLHAIWLCIAVPSGGQRLLETGEEEILKMDLGDVPLVVVFTKFDLLITNAEMEVDADWEPENPHCPVRALADEKYQQICRSPLNNALKALGRRSPSQRLHQCVSVEKNYENLLSNLIQITAKHVSPRAWAIWAIAQQVDAEMSRDAAIEIGRQKYWPAIATALYFKDRKLKSCLWALHVDTVMAWNFYDPHNCLLSSTMLELLSGIVSDLRHSKETGAEADSNEASESDIQSTITSGLQAATMAFSATTVSSMLPATLLSSMSPATLAVVPLAPIILLTRWIYDAYEKSPTVVQCLMGYILDLNFILWKLFWIIRKKGGVQPLTEDIVTKCLQSFNISEERLRIHQAVRNFIQSMKGVERLRANTVIDEVVRLLQEFCQEPSESD